MFCPAPNNKEKAMLKIQNSDNHETKKGKDDKHSTPSLFSLVIPLLLSFNLPAHVFTGVKGIKTEENIKEEGGSSYGRGGQQGGVQGESGRRGVGRN